MVSRSVFPPIPLKKSSVLLFEVPVCFSRYPFQLGSKGTKRISTHFGGSNGQIPHFLTHVSRESRLFVNGVGHVRNGNDDAPSVSTWMARHFSTFGSHPNLGGSSLMKVGPPRWVGFPFGFSLKPIKHGSPQKRHSQIPCWQFGWFKLSKGKPTTSKSSLF